MFRWFTRLQVSLTALTLLLNSVQTFAQNRPQWSKPLPLFYSLTASQSAGALLRANSQVSSFTGDGDLRWQYQPCPSCTDTAGPQILATQLLDGGGAWVLEENTKASRQLLLRRLDSNGALLNSFAVPVASDTQQSHESLLATDNEAVVFIANIAGLRWVRVGSQGVMETRDFAQAFPRIDINYFLLPPRRLSDGDVITAFGRGLACGFGSCFSGNVLVVRLAPDGTLRWRHTVTASTYFIGVLLNDDGSLLLVDDTSVTPLSAQGVPGVRQEQAVRLVLAAGPSNSRHFILGYTAGTYYHFLADAAGNLQPVPRLAAAEYLLAFGPQGFLVGGASLGADAVLLDPHQLAPLFSFDVDGQPAGPALVQRSWMMLSDGSIYAGTRAYSNQAPIPGHVSRLSRFAVPGSVAADRLFRSTFE